MAKKTIRRSIAATGAALTAAVLIGSGTAQAAQTSQTAPSVGTLAQAAATTSHLPGYGSNALIPTWWWGATTLCVKNVGGGVGRLEVQSVSPYAGPEYISNLAPSETRCIDRWWWGVPVWATNVSNTPLQVSSS